LFSAKNGPETIVKTNHFQTTAPVSFYKWHKNKDTYPAEPEHLRRKTDYIADFKLNLC
jgi:hypothetical protein